MPVRPLEPVPPLYYAWATPPWWWPPRDLSADEVDAWLAAVREVDAEGVPERADERGRFLPFPGPYERHYLRTETGGCCFGGGTRPNPPPVVVWK
jgi:hypothetical protein